MKNNTHNQQARTANAYGGTRDASTGGKGLLRLVYSARRSSGVTPTPVVIPVGSFFARFISLLRMRGPKDAASRHS